MAEENQQPWPGITKLTNNNCRTLATIFGRLNNWDKWLYFGDKISGLPVGYLSVPLCQGVWSFMAQCSCQHRTTHVSTLSSSSKMWQAVKAIWWMLFVTDKETATKPWLFNGIGEVGKRSVDTQIKVQYNLNSLHSIGWYVCIGQTSLRSPLKANT